MNTFFIQAMHYSPFSCQITKILQLAFFTNICINLDWANGIGWFIAMFCILSVPIVMILYLAHKWYKNGKPKSTSEIQVEN